MILAPELPSWRIRPLQPEDIPLLMQWDADPEIQRLTGKKFSIEDPLVWWKKFSCDRGRAGFAIVDDARRLIGDVSFEHIAWRAKEAEVRIAIGDPAYWNQGLGTQALNDALEFAFRQLKLDSIYLRVADENVRAIRSYMKVGFKKRGKLAATGHLRGSLNLILMGVGRETFYRVRAMAAKAGVLTTAVL